MTVTVSAPVRMVGVVIVLRIDTDSPLLSKVMLPVVSFKVTPKVAVAVPATVLLAADKEIDVGVPPAPIDTVVYDSLASITPLLVVSTQMIAE